MKLHDLYTALAWGECESCVYPSRGVKKKWWLDLDENHASLFCKHFCFLFCLCLFNVEYRKVYITTCVFSYKNDVER